MNESTAPPIAPAPSTATVPSGPTVDLTAPPGTALQIAQMLAAGTIDTAQAGKLARAGNVSTSDVARALHAGGAALIPPAPTAPAPTRPAPVEPHSHSSLSPSQAAQMIEWEKENLAKGKITPEEATRRFDALGATPEQRALDQRTDEQKAIDAAFPPAKAHEYVIPWYPPGEAPPRMPKEIAALDAQVRGWMSAAGLPANIGNALISASTRAKQATKRMTEAQIDQRDVDTFDKLQRLPDGGVLDEKFDAVNRMIHAIEVTNPGMYQFFKEHDLFKDAMVMNILKNHAQIYHARKGR